MMTMLSAWRSVLGEARVHRLDYGGDRAWVVRAQDARRYVLRRFVTIAIGEPILRLACEHRVLSHLRAAGVPVAVMLVTDDARLYAKDGDDIYVLAPELPSQKTDPETHPDAAEIYERIGAAFGHLHKALADYPHAVPSYVIEVAGLVEPESLEPIRRFDNALAGKAERLGAAMTEELDRLPRQLIHGDPHDGNVLLCNGEVSGFIDIDHLPVGPRIADLARYLANRVLWAIDAPEERMPSFWKLVDAMLNGYNRVNALLPGTDRGTGARNGDRGFDAMPERSTIYTAILARALSNVAWCLGHGDAESAYVVRSMKTAHWIADHHETLKARC